MRRETQLGMAVVWAAALAVVAVVVSSGTAVRVDAQPTAPTLTSNTPSGASWIASPTGMISAGFSEPVSGISAASMHVNGSLSGYRTGLIFGGSSNSASFLVSNPFIAGEWVDVTLTTAIASVASSLPIRERWWRYQVAAGVGPGAFGTGVGFGAVPTVQFARKSIAVADFNRDGELDVMEAAGGVELRFYENAGAGGMLAATTPIANLVGESSQLAVGDFNGDGWPDVWESRGPWGDRLWLGDTQGGFVPGIIPAIQSVAAALCDFNCDGWLDLVTVGPTGMFVWKNAGSGGLDAVPVQISASPAIAVATGDIKGNQYPDILAVGSAIFVSRNYGGWNFTPAATFGTGVYSDIKVADFNGDGMADVVAVGPTPTVGPAPTALWTSNGNGSFAKKTSPFNAGSAVAVAVGDIDGDGDADVVIGGDGSPSVRIWLNNGAGVLSAGGNGISGGGTSSLVLADMSGDGVLDLLDARTTGNTQIHRYVPYDRDTLIQAGGQQPVAAYSSVSSGPQTALSVQIVDSGLSDGLPTIVQSFRVNLAGSTGDANHAAWVLSGVGLLPRVGTVTGPVGSQWLDFGALSVVVPNGGAAMLVVTMDISTPPPGLIDNHNFLLSVSPSDIQTGFQGSQVSPFGLSVSNAPGVPWSVVATEIRAIQAPPPLLAIGENFTITAAFTDANGAVDRDVNGDVLSLYRGALTSVAVGTSSTAIEGMITFALDTSLSLSAPADPAVVLALLDDSQGSIDLSSVPRPLAPIALLDASADSRLLAGPAIERNGISSVQNPGVVVMDFLIEDRGVTGSGPTVVESVTIDLASSTADANDAVWTLTAVDFGPVVGTVIGTVGIQTIVFDGFVRTIPQGESTVFSLTVTPRASKATTRDREAWLLRVEPANIGLTAGGFHPGQTAITNGTGLTFSVLATELRFDTQPRSIEFVGDSFDVVIHFTDAYGNRDRDISGDLVSLARSDFGPVTAGFVGQTVNGRVSFTGINRVVLGLPHDTSGTLKLVAQDDASGSAFLHHVPAQSASFVLSPDSPSDVNGDGNIDVVDVQQLVNMILGIVHAEFPLEGDANRDGFVDVVDVQHIVNRILFN